MTGCSYCGTPGCEAETCPQRLEDKLGLPSDYDGEGELKTDGGTSTDGTDHPLFDYEPAAASQYDGDHACMFEDCDESADWLVDCKTSGYTGGKAFFCCKSCSRKNRIYAKENELYETDVDPDLADIIPADEIEHVRDLQPGTEKWDPKKDPFACSICGTALFDLERATVPQDLCNECSGGDRR